MVGLLHPRFSDEEELMNYLWWSDVIVSLLLPSPSLSTPFSHNWWVLVHETLLQIDEFLMNSTELVTLPYTLCHINCMHIFVQWEREREMKHFRKAGLLLHTLFSCGIYTEHSSACFQWHAAYSYMNLRSYVLVYEAELQLPLTLTLVCVCICVYSRNAFSSSSFIFLIFIFPPLYSAIKRSQEWIGERSVFN
jgi:hypothetical protein